MQKKDYEKSFYFAKAAADQGSALGLNRLGWHYRNGFGCEKNPEKAIEYIKKSAEMNCGSAYCNLGVLYKTGNGVEKNIEKAVELFKKSFELGYAESGLQLGILHLKGIGLPKDIKLAEKYLKAASDAGDRFAMYYLANIYEEQKIKYDEYYSLITKSAMMGLADAQLELARINVDKHPKYACAYYKKAADQNNPYGMYYYAICLEEGRGTKKNLKAARALYEKAAEMGVEEAAEWLSNN